MINKLLTKEHIYMDVDVKNKKEAFKFLAKQFYNHGFSTDEKKAYKGLLKRESEGSTGFNDHIAIPHAKIKEITKPGVFIVKFKNPLEWNSIDDSKVKVAISLAIPEDNSETDHLRILSSIARKLIEDDFRDALNNSTTVEELYELISTVEIK